jgi:mRNA-degrading endonuclease RelE of RelBE toxin-antitoxin system
MTWDVEWSPVAIRDFRSIPWRVAATVDHEIMKIARGHPPAGSIERMTPTDPSRYRLRLQSARVLFWVDRPSRTIHVTRVFRD